VQALETIHQRGAGNDWLQAWVAVTLLEAGRVAYLSEVRAALARRTGRSTGPASRPGGVA